VTGQRFAERVAVVTGARRGIGWASATRLAAEGASVALLDIHEDVVSAAEELGRAPGVRARAWRIDVSDEVAVDRCIRDIQDLFGGIDILHSHAGVLLPAAATDETVARWDRTFAVNVRGMFLMARAVLPAMRARGGGAIVLTGSMSGIIAEPGFLAYCASKAAVNHMAKQLALDFAADNVRVNAVCPGWVDTHFNDEFVEGMTEEELDALVREQVPLGRQGTVEDVAAAVAFLVSEEAAYITGHQLVIDGGYTIR
jgi:NAD(P)-dependent dehydrogenase (short-subunit alcohol dehydrogenase family)